MLFWGIFIIYFFKNEYFIWVQRCTYSWAVIFLSYIFVNWLIGDERWNGDHEDRIWGEVKTCKGRSRGDLKETPIGYSTGLKIILFLYYLNFWKFFFTYLFIVCSTIDLAISPTCKLKSMMAQYGNPFFPPYLYLYLSHSITRRFARYHT